MKLTALALPTLPRGDHPDAAYPGLTFRVGDKRRTWTLRHRVGDRQRRDILGRFPAMSLREARAAADALVERFAAGLPVLRKAPAATKGETLGDLIDAYEAMRKKEGKRIKRLEEAMRTVRRGLKDWLDLPAVSFSKRDLRAARDAINEGHTHIGNRLINYTSPILQWASEEDRISTNFARDIRRAAEVKRKRILTHDELAAAWHTLDRLRDAPGRGISAPSYARLVKFLILTGQRLGEAAGLRHGDILGGIWHQKANKSDRPHRVQLAQLALALVGNGEARSLVFPGEVGKIDSFAFYKRKLDRLSGVRDWRIHDLRRTFASGLQDLDIEPSIIEACLNHSLPGVMGTYLRSSLERQKAAAWAAWADQVQAIVGTRRAVS